MYRETLIVGALVAALTAIPVAHAQRAQRTQPGFRAPYTSYTGQGAFQSGAGTNLRYMPPPNDKQVAQMVRWNTVGQCVSGQDREASLAWVGGRHGAKLARTRLEPVFARCLAGSGITEPNDKALRRAALADALGVGLAQ
ncbi:hypothetical protein [Sphingomonas asaccharolytica]|uniref:hypothetical protein n=1 Tax=Sphingomonas asaccharolytica TaxID=40681 RepID=UPI0008332D86|nr:hypothetical protein [Sphingomonas asaccharolytica]